MKRVFQLFLTFSALATLALTLSGCGGGGGDSRTRGAITGNVTDIDGLPVADAEVTAGGRTVRSTQQGIYRLDNVGEGYRVVRASIDIDGTTYRGQNVAQLIVDNFGQQAKNVNITIAPEDDLGAFDGFVFDPNGNPLQGARIFAVSDNELSAATTVTNEDGYYELEGLIEGVNYQVVASGQGYENDSRTNRLVTAGDTIRLSFTLSPTTNPGFNAPNLRSATAYTVPSEVSRSKNVSALKAYDAIKQKINPSLKTVKKSNITRATPPGSLIEIDLIWDFIDDTAILGYGIFRGTSANNFGDTEFLRDPLANFYADQDDVLTPGVRYYYQISLLNTDYPDAPGSESPRSNTVSAQPLSAFGDTFFNTNNEVFSWDPVPGAQAYRIIVYNIYPDYDAATTVDVTVGNTTTYTYTGGALIPGRRYWYVITALSDQVSGSYTAQSYSDIGTFVAE